MEPPARIHSWFSPSITATIAATSILFLSGQANAQLFWDSNGTTAGFGNTTGEWGTSNFWNTDSAGGAGTFSSSTSSSDTVNFGTASANYDNAAVAIASGGVTVNSIVYGSAQTRAIVLGTAGNTLTLAGTTPTITVNNTRHHQVILSPIAGSAGLTKEGAGTLVLRGANVYTGGTTVNSGTLSFGTIASKSSGTHTFGAGTTLGLGFDGTATRFTAAEIQNAFAGTFTGNLAGISLDSTTNIAIDTTHGAQTFSANIGVSARGLVKIANGSNLTLTGANQYSGRTVVAGGSALIVNSLGNIADASSNIGTNSTIDMLDSSRIDIATSSSSDKHFNLLGGAVIFGGDNVILTHTGNISTETTGSKTLTLASNDTSFTNIKDFQGVISNGSGTIAVTKSNGGNIWLSGNNTYTGATTVSGGALIIGHANALGSTAAGTTVSNGATLGLRSGITTAAEALTLTPGASSTPMLRNYSGNNTWSGSITSNTGTSSNVSRIGSDAGKLTLGGTVSITGSVHQLVLQGDGNIDITGQITGVGFISSATAGAGVRKLANDTNNFTGATRVNGGTLEFTSIANVEAASSALGAPANATDGTINLGFDTTDATMRYVGTAPGGHTSDRVVRLNYTGTTTANYTLQASGTGPLVLTSGVTAANGSKTLTLSGTSTAANSIGPIANGGSGAIAVTKSGTGTWVLTGTHTYTGATNVNAGALLINGSTASGSAVTVAAGTSTGAPVARLGGTGTVGGNVTIAAESSSGFKNGGVLAPTAAASGTALKVTGITGFGTGSVFEWNLNASTSDTGLTNQGNYGQLVGTGAISGSNAVFSIVLGSNSFSDAFWNTDKTWNNVFTGAGATSTLASIFSSFAGADISPTGLVSGRGQFSFSSTSTLSWTAIPEPTSALAGLLLGAGLLRRKRRHG